MVPTHPMGPFLHCMNHRVKPNVSRFKPSTLMSMYISRTEYLLAPCANQSTSKAMNCKFVVTNNLLLPTSKKRPKFRSLRASSGSDLAITTETLGNDVSMTGGAYDFKKATISLTLKGLSSPKEVTLVRHGLGSWNEESRVQGSSNSSVLTEVGERQAEKCRKALLHVRFDQCFSSPISRAKSTAEILWDGREEPLIFLDSLREAHLFFLEGMKNGREFPCCDPQIHVEALICTALGLNPDRFRAIDVNNGGISVFKFNKQGEAVLQSLNMTAHMYSDHSYLY